MDQIGRLLPRPRSCHPEADLSNAWRKGNGRCSAIVAAPGLVKSCLVRKIPMRSPKRFIRVEMTIERLRSFPDELGGVGLQFDNAEESSEMKLLTRICVELRQRDMFELT